MTASIKSIRRPTTNGALEMRSIGTISKDFFAFWIEAALSQIGMRNACVGTRIGAQKYQ